ncbi:MAG: DUF3787 domain-containing protein [Clostridiales bacterium]|jgi:hypothetical protein|nr:DUF3787 domain-containing protein [Clostridiales bacterium]
MSSKGKEFDTLALAEDAARIGKENTTRPSDRAVSDAKHWVDENEK